MDDVRIREILTEHGYHPIGKKMPVNPQAQGHEVNPYCGDELTVYLDLNPAGEYQFIYQGQGCAVCMASASILSSTVQAPNQQELHERYSQALAFIHKQSHGQLPEYEDWEALSWFYSNPRRLACVDVAWKAAAQALGIAAK